MPAPHTKNDIQDIIAAITDAQRTTENQLPRSITCPPGYRWSPANVPSDDESARPRRRSSRSSRGRIPRVANIPLTPLEQNAPRRYKRIAMVFPLDMTQWTHPPRQFNEILVLLLRAFFVPVARWPFLAGKFVRSTQTPSELRLRYPRVLDIDHHKHLIQFQMPPWLSTEHKFHRAMSSNDKGKGKATAADLGSLRPIKEAPARVYMYFVKEHEKKELLEEERVAKKKESYELSIANVGMGRFNFQHDPGDHAGFHPVALCVSVEDDELILGFEFSELIFDLEFIRNFLHLFLKGTVDPNWQTSGITSRNVPSGAPRTQADPRQFKCYNWARSFVEMPTPWERLITKIITIRPRSILAIRKICRKSLQRMSEKKGIQTFPTVRDYLLAIMWVQIMRARYQNGRFASDMTARLNIAVASASHMRKPSGSNPDYFGNSTVTVVAVAQGEELSLQPDPEIDTLLDAAVPDDYAWAALEIRAVVDKVDESYVQRLTTAKSTMPGFRDRHAFDKANNPHTDSLSFEDWTELGDDTEVCLPYLRESRPFLLPCPDHLKEGTIIFLPRRSNEWSEEPWKVAVCLTEEDMFELEDLLNHEGLNAD